MFFSEKYQHGVFFQVFRINVYVDTKIKYKLKKYIFKKHFTSMLQMNCPSSFMIYTWQFQNIYIPNQFSKFQINK